MGSVFVVSLQFSKQWRNHKVFHISQTPNPKADPNITSIVHF